MADPVPAPEPTSTAAAPKPAATPAPAAPAAAAAIAVAEPAEPKLKVRKHKQRSCDERDAKGKLCAGHLKRYYDYPKDIAKLVGGPQVEIYRCEFCKTLYRPDPDQLSHSFTLRY